MTLGKISKSVSGLLKVVLVVFGCLSLQHAAHAQANDLMIVEYVDWTSGTGVAVKVYNPTPNPINLNSYSLNIYGNGSTTATTVVRLKNTLAAGATMILGNDEYVTSNCSNSANLNYYTLTDFVSGVNGDDVVALRNATGFVDMIGRVGYSAGNGNSQKVGTTSDALYQKKIVRQPANLSRYSLTSGTYNATNVCGANIWPNNTSTSVLGWTVSSATCITGTWTLPTLSLTGTDVTLNCKTSNPINLSASSNPPISTPGITVQWSGGKGTFSNANAINPTYTPSPGDFNTIKLNVILTLCGRQVSDLVTIINGDSTERTSGFTFSPQSPLVNEVVTFTLQNRTASQTKGNWNFGDGSTTANQNNPTQHIFTKAGTYRVKVDALNRYGCSDTLSKRLTVTALPPVPPAAPVVTIIPNVFTPNGDNVNDTYHPQIAETSSYSLKVFNRWGVRVFESTEPKKEWDGKNTSDGIYYVHLKVTYLTGETATFKLPVTVVR